MIDSINSLIAFLKHFHRAWLAEPSLDVHSIPPALPEVLKTLYAGLGGLVEIRGTVENDWRAPFAAQDSLYAPGQLRWIEGMVEFAAENQGNWTARCPIREADPPVYSNWVEYWEPPLDGHQRVCDSLSHFLMGLCLQEAVMSCRNLVTLDGVSDPSSALTIALEPLWLGGRHLGDEAAGDFYYSPNWEVLVMMGSGPAWLGSPTHSLKGLAASGRQLRSIHSQM